MRKVPVLCFCFGLGLVVAANAQQPVAAPSDPKALMLAASKLNNLATADAKPWHVKASFQLLDEKGTVTDKGAYEEFWAGPTKFKRIFTGKAFAQTNYGSEKGELRAGAQGTIPNYLINARNDLVNALPSEQIIALQTYAAKPVKLGELNFVCLNLANGTGPAYCLAGSEAVLRITSYPYQSLQILHNRLLHFGDHIVAGDLKVNRAGNTVLTLHVDTLETIAAGNEAVFSPPPDAVPVPRVITVAGGVAQGMLAYKVAAEYPSAARNSHITGTVVLRGIIGKDGKVNDLHALSGPDVLQGAAIQAVQQWRYRPYLLNGEPVEVQTTINVVFQLSN